jgi:hypothetical protein
MAKSNIVSSKDFYKIKAGQTLFSPRIDQFGVVTLKEFFFEGKRVKAEPDSIWMYGFDNVVFPFKKKGKNLIGVPGRYPENSLLFWTRRSALNYATDVKNGIHTSEKLVWWRYVRKQLGLHSNII